MYYPIICCTSGFYGRSLQKQHLFISIETTKDTKNTKTLFDTVNSQLQGTIFQSYFYIQQTVNDILGYN